MHQPRHVLEAHVARLQLFVIQHAHASPRPRVVPLEGEIDFLDTVRSAQEPNSASAPGRRTTEKDVVSFVHRSHQLSAIS